jgi:DNA polymerase-3 subunit chi
MGVVSFYQLGASPLAEALMALIGKARGAGLRIVLRGSDPAQMAALDAALWLGPADSFLAHGLAGGPHDADQPVLLTTLPDAPNGADCLMAVGGAPVSPTEAGKYARSMILFDGADDAALQAARAQWRSLTAAACKAEFWAQQDGRWLKMAESK